MPPRLELLSISVPRFVLTILVVFSGLAIALPSAEAQKVTACAASLRFEVPVSEEICAAMKELVAANKLDPNESLLVRGSKAKDLAGRLQSYLVSEGYYEANVRSIYSDAVKREFVFSVAPHGRYKVTDYKAVYEGADAPLNAKGDRLQPADVLPEISRSPRAFDIVSVQDQFLTYLRNNGRPFSVQLERLVQIHRETKEATVVFRIDPGAPCVYGNVSIDGLERVQLSYVRGFLSLKPEALCSREGLAAQKSKLANTGLFTLVDVKLMPEEAQGSSTPVAISLKEGKSRTVGVGLSYETNTGIGTKLTWAHRNLLGRGEKLEAALKLKDITQSVSVDFQKLYASRNVTMFAGFDITQEAKDAYDSREVSSRFGYDRPFLNSWRLRYSVDLQYAEVVTDGITETGIEVSLPMRLQRSKVDNALSPLKGHRLSFQVVPVRSAVGEGVTFVQTEARGSLYHPLDDEKRNSLALWSHWGATLGGTYDDIPSTRLFYGGGLQSVRAIEYERLGTIDANNVPVGGRSIFEGGVELRSQVTSNWSVVTFLEAGRSFASDVPDFKEDLLTGGGFGLRYATPVGPLRIDIAAPFDPRPSDANLQFYIGIGQAF